ncbi:MAG: alpha-glucosidase [Promethearchaeota archaeon]
MSKKYKTKWYQGTTVYQIYPRSFKDSTGNGIGDLPGIVEKLDYLQDLGIETIWFSPFFDSPQRDHGYDVKNFRDIAPEYGTLNDFDTLLKEMHDRNMKMILDLVLNHTSSDHPWFIESSSSRDNPKRNWYIWRDGKKSGGKKPPNNWITMTGGTAWLYYENTDQWVYFHFLPSMIDLNYRNPEVKEEMFNTMRFWLDKGVDGFRLDILHAIYEDEQLRDDTFCRSFLPSDKNDALLFHSHKYDLNLPETYDFAMELRKVVDEYEPERVLIGEVSGNTEESRKYYGPNNDGLHMSFLFEYTSTPFNPEKYAKIISKIEKILPFPYTPTYVLGNHDRMRYITLLKNNTQKAKLLATMQLTLRGVPFIYYGEEIGIPNVRFKLKTSQDPIGRKYSWFPMPLISRLIGFSLTRDGCRTPMQWNVGPNAGFSPNVNIKPWLRLSKSYKKLNVFKEEKDVGSLLNCYKKLLKTRKRNIALQEGEFQFYEPNEIKKKLLAYRRIHEVQELYIFLNFSKKALLINTPKQEPELLFSTLPNREALDPDSYDGNLRLTPFEGIIFK